MCFVFEAYGDERAREVRAGRCAFAVLIRTSRLGTRFFPCTFWLSVWLVSCGRSGENNPVVSTTRKVTTVNEGRVWVFS